INLPTKNPSGGKPRKEQLRLQRFEWSSRMFLLRASIADKWAAFSVRMYILRDCPRQEIVRNRVEPTKCHRQTKVVDHWSGSSFRTVVGLREIGWKSFPFASVPASV
ncbi:hypothetical protein ASPFODRAFT_143006, partial [Aspergillus luchuensis CBS 106.47]